ncbi:hypothetical protein [Paucilactobacillus hokkaidonensis]|nr:hypothetical protein [Paucilactobacillus hokkaidonensis]
MFLEPLLVKRWLTFFQRQFISTLPVDEDHDLQLIEDQILRSVGA